MEDDLSFDIFIIPTKLKHVQGTLLLHPGAFSTLIPPAVLYYFLGARNCSLWRMLLGRGVVSRVGVQPVVTSYSCLLLV